jgi:hypothetical protein
VAAAEVRAVRRSDDLFLRIASHCLAGIGMENVCLELSAAYSVGVSGGAVCSRQFEGPAPPSYRSRWASSLGVGPYKWRGTLESVNAMPRKQSQSTWSSSSSSVLGLGGNLLNFTKVSIFCDEISYG